jgi:integrase
MGFSPSITRRDRRRRLNSGRLVVQTRFVVNFRDPATGRRKQLFFARQKDAIAMRDAMVASVATGTALTADPAGASTVADIMEHWLQNRKSEVKGGTWASYCQAAQYVVGPLLLGTKLERHRFARYGVKRTDALSWTCWATYGSAT